jgi:ankyrin repeat protein
LHEAAACGHTKTCQLLIENGADITRLDKRNCSPFLLACGSDNADTAMYLATQVKSEDSYLFSLKMESGKSPLHKAVGSGHIEVVKLLLNKIDVSTEINSQDTKRGHTPLHVAALNGSPEIIEHLLAYGASTTITDKKGYTPFQVCYKRWTKSSSTDAIAVLLLMDRESKESLKDLTLLNTAAVKGSVPVLTKLLDRGATLNHPDEHGWTPLQLASQYGHSDAVKLLSDRGVVIGRKPTGWICSVDTVKISEDRKVAEYIALGKKPNCQSPDFISSRVLYRPQRDRCAERPSHSSWGQEVLLRNQDRNTRRKEQRHLVRIHPFLHETISSNISLTESSAWASATSPPESKGGFRGGLTHPLSVADPGAITAMTGSYSQIRTRLVRTRT